MSGNRLYLLIGLAIIILKVVLVPVNAQEDKSITVVSFGGASAMSSVKAYHERFTRETGIQIKLDEYNGELGQLRTQVESGNVTWDVIDMVAGTGLLACDEGLLEPLNYDFISPAPDGTPARKDFIKMHDMECGIENIVASTIYAYNDTIISGQKPTTIADFFDLEKFPGRRGMRRVPYANLEFALVADGVPVRRIYDVLSTEEGIKRAFRKLDTIKSEVVWWESGAQPPQMLADGEVVMSTAYNGRIFNAWALEKQPLVIVWDSQIIGNGYKVIVAGTPKLELARQFVRFASTTESLALRTRYISYGPLRHSSLSRVDKHEATGIDMKPHLPNAPENMANAVWENPEWWVDNQDEMNERFAVWLAR